MIVSVLDCYDSTDGNLLLDLAKHMKWKSSPPSESVHINKKDINEMRKFVTIMSPMKKLFSSLNSDTESTIQKLYPTLLNLVALVDQYTEDSSSSACSFATELRAELFSTFDYVLDPSAEDFEAIFVATTMLDPFFHSLVSTNAELKAVTIAFLSKLVVSHGSSAEPAAARPRTSYKLKGYEFLTPSVTQRRVGSSGSPLEQDISMYLNKAASYVERARSEANQDVTDDNGNNGKTMQCVSLFNFLL